MRHDLVVIDELGYLPFSQSGAQLLFHLISKLYESTSIVITTNLTFAGGPQANPSVIRERPDDEARLSIDNAAEMVGDGLTSRHLRLGC